MEREEAIKIVKSHYPANTQMLNEALEFLIPELKESEDERIRKVLIDYFKTYKKQEECGIKTFFGIPTDNILAWLEKQGEKKVPSIDFKAKDCYVSEVDGNIHNMTYDAADKVEPKNMEDETEIPFDANDSELTEVTYDIPKGFHAEIDDDKVVIKIGEKPTAWSEEDKNFMYDTLSNLTELKDRYGEGYGNVGKCIEWLKSLKERVQPQNNSITDEELEQAKKDAYNDALDKIEYHSGEPTFADGWHAAIDYIQKHWLEKQGEQKATDKSEYVYILDYCSGRVIVAKHDIKESINKDFFKKLGLKESRCHYMVSDNILSIEYINF